MLFKNIWKVASATTLGMGLLSGGVPAIADLNFDPPATARQAPITLSKQTLRNGTGNPAFYPVDVSGATNATDMGHLEAFVEPGILHTVIDENTNLYLRYDFGPHVKLAAQPDARVETYNDQGTADDLTDDTIDAVSNTYARVESSLTDGYLLVQFGEDDTGGGNIIRHNSRLAVDFDAAVSTSGRGAATVRVRGYSEALDAIALRNELFDHQITLFNVADSVTVTVKPGTTAIAEVETGFLQFKNSPTLIRLGSFEFKLATTAAGTAATRYANDLGGVEGGTLVAGPQTVTAVGNDGDFGTFMETMGVDVTTMVGTAAGSHTIVSGDPGFGFTMRTTFCNTAEPVVHHPDSGSLATVDKDDEAKAGPLIGGVAWHPWYLCFTMSPANMVAIEEGNYYLDVNFKQVADPIPFPISGVTEALFGRIERNGTTVHIPFVSSYENYVQRLVIRSRNKQPVDWSIEFQTEEDGMVTTHMDGGMLLGESTTMMRIAEMATFEMPTRGSATLTIVSDPRHVDVATTQVNTGDGSTDTVVYHRGLHEGDLSDVQDNLARVQSAVAEVQEDLTAHANP